jgi:hypothetical protein
VVELQHSVALSSEDEIAPLTKIAMSVTSLDFLEVFREVTIALVFHNIGRRVRIVDANYSCLR